MSAAPPARRRRLSRESAPPQDRLPARRHRRNAGANPFAAHGVARVASLQSLPDVSGRQRQEDADRRWKRHSLSRSLADMRAEMSAPPRPARPPRARAGEGAAKPAEQPSLYDSLKAEFDLPQTSMSAEDKAAFEAELSQIQAVEADTTQQRGGSTVGAAGANDSSVADGLAVGRIAYRTRRPMAAPSMARLDLCGLSHVITRPAMYRDDDDGANTETHRPQTTNAIGTPGGEWLGWEDWVSFTKPPSLGVHSPERRAERRRHRRQEQASATLHVTRPRMHRLSDDNVDCVLNVV